MAQGVGWGGGSVRSGLPHTPLWGWPGVVTVKVPVAIGGGGVCVCEGEGGGG